MTNPVLAETGPLSTSRPLTLVHYGGTRTVTRGTFARLEQTEGELGSAFSRSGLNAWVSTPANTDEVEFVVVDGTTYRALDEERVLGAFDTTRFQLVETTDVILPPITVVKHFDPADFGSDFNTGR